jgi:hypothetical protein
MLLEGIAISSPIAPPIPLRKSKLRRQSGQEREKNDQSLGCRSSTLGFNREPLESTHFGTILVEGSLRTNVFDPPDEERLQTKNEVSRFQQRKCSLAPKGKVCDHSTSALSALLV